MVDDILIDRPDLRAERPEVGTGTELSDSAASMPSLIACIAASTLLVLLDCMSQTVVTWWFIR